MIVTCQECMTRFTVDENIINKAGSEAKCSVCNNIFMIYPEPAENISDTFSEELLSSDDEFDDDDYKRQKRAGTGTIAVILILVLLGAAVVLELSGVNIPFLRKISFTGKILDKTENLSNKKEKFEISVLEVKADIINNKNIGRLFVITGKVKNNYTDPLSFIRISAKLYTADKILVKTRDVFCGNIIPADDLKEFGIDKINQILENPAKNQKDASGIKQNESIPFMVVFSDFPENPGKFDIVVKELQKMDN